MIGNAFPMSASAMTGAPRAGHAASVASAANGQGTSGDDSRAPSTGQSPRNAAAGNAASDNAANPSAKTDGSNVEAPATHAAAGRDAAQDTKTACDEPGTTPTDFATLLEASTAATSNAAPAPALLVSADTTAPAATDPNAQAGLPDQLLALLNGSWALPAAATSTAVSAEAALPPGAAMSALPTLANALPANAAAASATTTTTTAPVATTAAATAAPGVPPIAAGSGAFAALNELAATSARAAGDSAASLEAATAIDTSSAPDPTALTAAAPILAPTRAGAPAPTAAIVLPADPDAGFDDAFGGRIAWMAEQRIGHAEIRISPEHLGPIDVRIQLDGTRVSAEFHSAHAEVRHALESSVTRLRDLLGQHGLQLGQADVGQRQAGQGQAARRDGDGSGSGATSGDGLVSSDAGPRLRSRGLLDEYA